MSELKDPPRLLDPESDAPDALRELLQAGRADLPDAAQLARLASRLPVGTPGAPPANGAPPSPPAPLAVAPAAPSALSGALIGGALAIVVVGAVWVRDAMTAREPAPTSMVAATSSTASPRVDDVPQMATPAPTSLPSSARAPEPTPSVAAKPSAPPSAAPPAESAAPVAPVESETEVQLLQRAQDALRRSPAEALAVTDEHQRRFPGGALGQEREVLAINALAALGRTADARARAERFLAAHPGSAYRSRLDALLPGLSAP